MAKEKANDYLDIKEIHDTFQEWTSVLESSREKYMNSLSDNNEWVCYFLVVIIRLSSLNHPMINKENINTKK